VCPIIDKIFNPGGGEKRTVTGGEGLTFLVAALLSAIFFIGRAKSKGTSIYYCKYVLH
jgi:hypothetical protein